jgi:hypothetical protein
MTRLIDDQKARLRGISREKEADTPPASDNRASPSTLRAMNYIDDLKTKDDENYAQISIIFKTEIDLINDLVDLYELCGIALKPHLKDVGARIAGALVFGMGRNHLVRGTLSLSRAHAAPMFRETRSAVEAAGMACCVMKHDDMRDVLLADVGTRETRAAMKKTFTQKRIFPKEKKVFRQLRSDYDYCSWRAHTNMASFMTHIGRTDEGQAALQVQDIRSGTATGEVALYFMHLLLSHLHILTSVDESFDHFDVTEKLEEFMAARDAFTARLMEVIWKWRGRHILERMEDQEWLKSATEGD